MEKPTAPPPIWLSPAAIPVAEANDITMRYTYVVSKRNRICCYEHVFTLQKRENAKFKLTFSDLPNSYCIPCSKTNKEITQIIAGLGAPTASWYMIKVYHNDSLLDLKRFMSLSKVVDFIDKTELLVEGVQVEINV